MSACSPLMMLCACVVLPPNDVRNCTSWPSCASFHSDCHVEISLPYARYGLLYAASVTTGEAAGEEELHPAAPDALELEHAASPMSERTSGAARMRRLNHRGMERSFRLGRHSRCLLGTGPRPPVVRSTERRCGWRSAAPQPRSTDARGSGCPVAHRRPRKDA